MPPMWYHFNTKAFNIYYQYFLTINFPPISTIPLFSHQVLSSSSQPHGLPHTRFLCPLLSPRVCSNSCVNSALNNTKVYTFTGLTSMCWQGCTFPAGSRGESASLPSLPPETTLIPWFVALFHLPRQEFRHCRPSFHHHISSSDTTPFLFHVWGPSW